MWHKSKTAALLVGMRTIGRQIDPDELVRRAKDAGLRLPLVAENVSAPSLGSGAGLAWQVPATRLAELRDIIDQLVSRGGKKAA